MTTGAIAGRITSSDGARIEAAQVTVTNTGTGHRTNVLSRDNGLFAVQGLEVGGPYRVSVRRLGFQPAERDGLVVSLSQTTRADFSMVAQAAQISGVVITSTTTDPIINPSRTGTGTTVNDSALRRLPTLNRNFADFVQLVPQVSTTTGSLSGGGVNIRQNGIQIDGAAASDLFGLGTTGQPGSQANAKSIPLDAVKEYQVLLAPFDVRQGNFGGLLINAVTKSGTNEFHGSAYGYSRTDGLTRSQPYLREFLQQQFGFAVGGPILKDRLFFFVNPEWQKFQTPTSGPFIGSADAPVSQASIDQFTGILNSRYGFAGAGTGEKVERENPLTNVFARLDAVLPFNTRLVLRHNYAKADNTNFSRSLPTALTPNFSLTSNQYQFSSETNSSVAEFLTTLPRGLFNELLLNYTTIHDFRTVPVVFPEITVTNIPRSDGKTGTVRLVAGTDASSQGNALDQRYFEITENLTIPMSDHQFTFGTKNLFYKPVNLFAQNRYGTWEFSSLANLDVGVASRYQVSAPAATDPAGGLATFNASLYSFYAQDIWSPSERLALTFGIRYEKPDFGDAPPENTPVLISYGRNTSHVPDRATISPRFAFNWDMTGDQRNQLRGGVGYFAGIPPFVYLSNAFGNSGLSGYAQLTCTGTTSATATTSLAVPTFNSANIANPPTQCAPSGTRPGATVALGSAINTIDPDFRFPQYRKISAAYDRRFLNGLISTVEFLHTSSVHNPFYRNLALVGPQGVDRNGRVLYGTFTTSGASPTTKGGRTAVLDVTNSSGDYTYSITGMLQKTFFERFDGSLAYNYMQARDIVTVTSSTAGSNFRYQRSVSGNLDDRTVTKSKNDQPHRIIATGSYRLPTKTDISFIYIGNSGAPFDYVYQNPGGTRGDLNADGQSQNDLIYVPVNTLDPNEILFFGYNGTAAQQATAATEAAAFEAFIAEHDCLNNSRGQILTRNACRNPWQNQIDVSVAQSLRLFGGQNVALRLDVINFSNLVNKKWGLQRFSNQGSTCGSNCSATNLLRHEANVLGATPGDRRGVFSFSPTFEAFDATNISSNYRMQLSFRYSF
ncbi:MAG: carboxypeptidase regulatory-like domain-containing protein [Gemmatimonadaceae bacterium]